MVFQQALCSEQFLRMSRLDKTEETTEMTIRYKLVMWDRVKGLGKVETYDVARDVSFSVGCKLFSQ